MSKKGSTNVQPVDPWKAGRADATFNRIDSYTPFGNLTYSGPNRNQATLQLNPYLAGNEERRMLSDRMLLDTALGRQQQMNQGGLPSLTSGINPGAMQQFFGLPSNLQTGFDQAPTPPTPPNVIPGSDTPSGAGAKGGQQQLPGAPPGGPPQPGQKGQMGGNMEPPYRPGADVAGKPGMGVGDGYGGQPQGGAKGGAQQPQGGFGSYGQGGLGSNGWDGLQPRVTNAQQPQGGNAQLMNELSNISRGGVEQATFDRTASLLNPMYDQEYQSKVSDLRARGIPRDSEAFEREMANFERNKGETFGRLADQSVLSGGQEQSRLFGMADMLGQRDIQAQLQNANISSMNRATQFNELASLLGLQQVASPGLNNFFAPGNVDMMGAYGMNQQGQMANARNAAGQKGGLMGGLGQLGGAALGNWGEIFG